MTSAQEAEIKTGLNLFPATNPTLPQTLNAETPITAEIWQNRMDQLNKANQDNKLPKKAYMQKPQQNEILVVKATYQSQAITTKAKNLPKDTSSKATKSGKILPENK